MPINDDLPFSPTPDGNATASALFQAIVFDTMIRLNVAKPATVVSWAPPQPGKLPATVRVTIDFKYARSINNASEIQAGELLVTETAGLRAVGTWAALPTVPVVQFGSPTFCWRGAIPAGTTGLLVFMDAAIDQWKSSGGPLDPALANKHNINDAVFLPTLYHGSNAPTIDPLVDIIGPDDGSAGLEIATGTDKSIKVFTDGPQANLDAATAVKLGDALTATLGVARLSDDVAPTADMTAFMSAVVTALTTIAAAVPVVIVPPIPPATIGVISSASTKVQAE